MKTDRFISTVSNKFNWNEGLNTVGDTLKGIFQKPAQNVTYVVKDEDDNEDKDKDNTMLYVGIGGMFLLVILLIVMLK